MDLNEIKKLIKVVESSNISDFEIEEGELKIKISKKLATAPETQIVSIPQAPVVQASAPVVETTSDATKQEVKSNTHEVKSPIVGTFYAAPAPDADDYVSVGDQIKVGNVLCIVEAMKLMNEIESDVDGKIVKILVENGSPVEYNQPLFLVEKN